MKYKIEIATFLKGFNPCFNGTYSLTIKVYEKGQEVKKF